jgi:predicted nucleic acid-binding protein
MKAFDTDILTEILSGNPAYAERIANIPPAEQAAPVVAVEEIVRGRLNMIRQAEAGKSRISIDQAYQLFEQTLAALHEIKTLSFTDQAETLFKEWPLHWFREIAAISSTFRDCRLNSGNNLTGHDSPPSSIPSRFFPRLLHSRRDRLESLPGELPEDGHHVERSRHEEGLRTVASVRDRVRFDCHRCRGGGEKTSGYHAPGPEG